MSLISVLMPAYNSEKYIGLAIKSILSQSLSDFEFIIIDDGSTDNTHEIISSFTDKRIRYYRNDINEGLTRVRNKLISLAVTEYLAFLDSDDIADQNRLKEEYALFQSNKALDLVAASAVAINPMGGKRNEKWSFNLDADQLKAHLLFYNPVVTSTVMFRKSKVPVDGFRIGYPPCEDYDFWTRMLYSGKGVVLPVVLVAYRLHDASISKVQSQDAISNRNKVVLDQLAFYFAGKYSQEEADLHLGLVDFSMKNNKEDINRLLVWVERLISLNKQYDYFNDEVLRQLLYDRLLKKLLRLKKYDLSVFRALKQVNAFLNPKKSTMHLKKELAILLFSFFRNKFID